MKAEKEIRKGQIVSKRKRKLISHRSVRTVVHNVAADCFAYSSLYKQPFLLWMKEEVDEDARRWVFSHRVQYVELSGIRKKRHIRLVKTTFIQTSGSCKETKSNMTNEQVEREVEDERGKSNMQIVYE